MSNYSDYIITYVLGFCSLVLTGVDLWIYLKDSQGLIDSSNCTTAPLNTFFTYALVSLALCMLALWLVVYESKKNVQSWFYHVVIGLIWMNALVCASMGVDWHNRASVGVNCNSDTSYKTMVVLFVNFCYLFLTQAFIVTLGLLGIGTHFAGLDPVTETAATNSYAHHHNNNTLHNNYNNTLHHHPNNTLYQNQNQNVVNTVEPVVVRETGVNDLVRG